MRDYYVRPSRLINMMAVAAVIVTVMTGPMQAQARASSQPEPEPQIWGACGVSDDSNKLVRKFPRAQGSAGANVLPAGDSDLYCGNESWGYLHILKNHRTEWENDAAIVGRNWRTQADWAIAWVLRDPGVVTYRAANDTFCYSREVYLGKDGKVVATRRPNVVVAGNTRKIITAFPANTHCR